MVQNNNNSCEIKDMSMSHAQRNVPAFQALFEEPDKPEIKASDQLQGLVFGDDDSDIEKHQSNFKIFDTDNNCPTITRRPIFEGESDKRVHTGATEILSYRSNKYMQPNIVNKQIRRF